MSSNNTFEEFKYDKFSKENPFNTPRYKTCSNQCQNLSYDAHKCEEWVKLLADKGIIDTTDSKDGIACCLLDMYKILIFYLYGEEKNPHGLIAKYNDGIKDAVCCKEKMTIRFPNKTQLHKVYLNYGRLINQTIEYNKNIYERNVLTYGSQEYTIVKTVNLDANNGNKAWLYNDLLKSKFSDKLLAKQTEIIDGKLSKARDEFIDGNFSNDILQIHYNYKNNSDYTIFYRMNTYCRSLNNNLMLDFDISSILNSFSLLDVNGKDKIKEKLCKEFIDTTIFVCKIKSEVSTSEPFFKRRKLNFKTTPKKIPSHKTQKLLIDNKFRNGLTKKKSGRKLGGKNKPRGLRPNSPNKTITELIDNEQDSNVVLDIKMEDEYSYMVAISAFYLFLYVDIMHDFASKIGDDATKEIRTTFCRMLIPITYWLQDNNKPDDVETSITENLDVELLIKTIRYLPSPASPPALDEDDLFLLFKDVTQLFDIDNIKSIYTRQQFEKRIDKDELDGRGTVIMNAPLAGGYNANYCYPSSAFDPQSLCSLMSLSSQLINPLYKYTININYPQNYSNIHNRPLYKSVYKISKDYNNKVLTAGVKLDTQHYLGDYNEYNDKNIKDTKIREYESIKLEEGKKERAALYGKKSGIILDEKKKTTPFSIPDISNDVNKNLKCFGKILLKTAGDLNQIIDSLVHNTYFFTGDRPNYAMFLLLKLLTNSQTESRGFLRKYYYVSDNLSGNLGGFNFSSQNKNTTKSRRKSKSKFKTRRKSKHKSRRKSNSKPRRKSNNKTRRKSKSKTRRKSNNKSKNKTRRKSKR